MPNAPYPSPADVGYLLFYPLAYAGLALLVRARAHEINWRLWMDGAIAALGTAALGAAFVFDFVAGKAEGTPLQVATTLAYPLGDILMVAMVIGVVALTGWRPGRTWSLLLAGLSALVIADIAYTLQSTGEALPGGGWIDPIYLIAAICLGAAVWQPAEAAEITSPADGDGRREIVVPGGLRQRDDRPLRDAVLQRDQRPLDRSMGGDDDRGDPAAGDERQGEQGAARAGTDRSR